MSRINKIDNNLRLDEILDKILIFGLKALNKNELEFLDAFSRNDEVKMTHLEYESRLRDFISNDGHFYFVFSHSVSDLDCINYFGNITVPDLIFEDDSKIIGTIQGHISVQLNGDKIPVFEKNGYDILEFCNGLEYELDNFIDYVIETLEDEKNSR